MIQDLILNSNSGKATIIANEDLDKLKNDGKLVIAFGQQETFAHMGVVGIKTENIMSWVIEQKNDITEDFANAIFEQFYLSTTISSGFYIPMFYLCRFTSKYDNNEKLKTMSINLSLWVDKINRNQNIKTYNTTKEIYKDFENLSISALLQGIVKTYANGNITYSACLKVLTDLNDKQALFKDTNFRKAITYLDMKK